MRYADGILDLLTSAGSMHYAEWGGKGWMEIAGD